MTKISAQKNLEESKSESVDAVCEGVDWRQGSEDDCEHQDRRVTLPTHSLMTSVDKSDKLAKDGLASLRQFSAHRWASTWMRRRNLRDTHRLIMFGLTIDDDDGCG